MSIGKTEAQVIESIIRQLKGGALPEYIEAGLIPALEILVEEFATPAARKAALQTALCLAR